MECHPIYVSCFAVLHRCRGKTNPRYYCSRECQGEGGMGEGGMSEGGTDGGGMGGGGMGEGG